MKNRYILQNITELVSIIEHCNSHNIPAIAISYDFMKAFDKCSWLYLQKVLEFLNFGPFFRLLVRILQTDMISMVSNSNHWSERFSNGKGLAQGCPASPALFLILVQSLGSKIMQNKDIKGISIDGVEKKLSQYADDLWTPMLFEQEFLSAMLTELADFERASGLSINFSKTNVLRIGAAANTNMTLQSREPLNWTNDPISVLGIKVHSDIQYMKTVTYQEALDKVQAKLAVWQKRPLTIIGKIRLFNTLAVSLCVYKMMALGTPSKEFFKNIKQIGNRFVWKGKPPRVKYTKLVQPYMNGGLKLCDVEKNFSV